MATLGSLIESLGMEKRTSMADIFKKYVFSQKRWAPNEYTHQYFEISSMEPVNSSAGVLAMFVGSLCEFTNDKKHPVVYDGDEFEDWFYFVNPKRLDSHGRAIKQPLKTFLNLYRRDLIRAGTLPSGVKITSPYFVKGSYFEVLFMDEAGMFFGLRETPGFATLGGFIGGNVECRWEAYMEEEADQETLQQFIGRRDYVDLKVADAARGYEAIGEKFFQIKFIDDTDTYHCLSVKRGGGFSARRIHKDTVGSWYDYEEEDKEQSSRD